MRFLNLVILFFAANLILAQEHFLVELEDRSPDAKALVQGFEGYPSIPFMANDYMGNEISIMDMKGKPVILWFWKLDCPKCMDQLPEINRLHTKYKDEVHFVSFSEDDKNSLKDYSASNDIGFPIIANAKTLSEGPYGAELGYPKIFIIDEFGITKWVIPEMEMKNNFDVYNFLETLIISLKK